MDRLSCWLLTQLGRPGERVTRLAKAPCHRRFAPAFLLFFFSRHSCTAAILAQGEEVGNIITLSIRYSVAIQKEKKMVWFGSSTCMPTDEKPPGGEELHRQAPAVRKEMRQLVQYWLIATAPPSSNMSQLIGDETKEMSVPILFRLSSASCRHISDRRNETTRWGELKLLFSRSF